MPSPIIGRRRRWLPNSGAAVDLTSPFAAGLQAAVIGGRVLHGTEVQRAQGTGAASIATPFGQNTPPVAVRHTNPPTGAVQITQLAVMWKQSGFSGQGCLINTQATDVAAERVGFSFGIGDTQFSNNGNNIVSLDNAVAWRTYGTVALANGPHVILHETTPGGASGNVLYIDSTAVSYSATAASQSDLVFSVFAAQYFSAGSATRGLTVNSCLAAGFVWQGVTFTMAQRAALLADPFCFLRF